MLKKFVFLRKVKFFLLLVNVFKTKTKLSIYNQTLKPFVYSYKFVVKKLNLFFKTFFLRNFKKKVLRKKRKFKKSFKILITFFFKFFLFFLENFFKRRIFIKIKKKTTNRFIIKFYKQLRSIKSPLKINKNLKNNFNRNIIYTIFYCLVLKDTYLLVNFLKKVLEGMHLKQHKKFFLYLKKIFYTVKYFFIFLGVRGVFFNVKGKISVTGNAKKRRFFFKFRESSLTKKTLKIENTFTEVRTVTGVLGLVFFLFF